MSIVENVTNAVPFKTASKEGVRCQSGGGQQHTLSTTASYGYTNSGGFKTSGYPPITKNVTAHSQCGGKRRRKTKRKSRKRKTKRKSRRRKYRKKRKSRKQRYKHKGGANCKCKKCCGKKKNG